MKYRICISALLLWAGMQVSASNNQKEVVIKIIETSDVHGNFFPYNFIERKEWSGSLARVHSFVKEQREKFAIATCTFICCFVTTKVISLIPGGKWIVG